MRMIWYCGRVISRFERFRDGCVGVVVAGGEKRGKIAYKGGFCIKKFQACKKGKNCVGVDNT